MNIVCTLDKNYVVQTTVMLVSILKNTQSKCNFYIISEDLEYEDYYFIQNNLSGFGGFELHKFKVDLSDFKEIEYSLEQITFAANIRLFLQEILPEYIDKVLYIDGDVIVKSDLKKVYDYNLGDFPIGATPGLSQELGKHLNMDGEFDYFHSGFMLINLRQWREKNYLQRFKEIYSEYKENLIYIDQDVLNIAFKDKWKLISAEWNVCTNLFEIENFQALDVRYPGMEEVWNPKVIHFNGPLKPWNFTCTHPFKSEYYRYGALLKNKVEPFDIGKYKKIYLFGSGSFAKKIYHLLNLNNIFIEKVIDNNPSKRGQNFMGIEIISLSEYLEMYNDDSIIVIGSSFRKDIISQLKKYEITNYIY